jgi:preprotein translocase subunit YajC
MGSAGFLLIVVAFAFLYFVLVRPQKKRQLQARQMLDHLAVGDEVVTAGGLHGRISELHDEHVMLEIADKLHVKVARRAIGAVVPAAEPEEREETAETEPAEPPVVENGG